MVYNIRTQERSYNSVDSPKQFRKVRKNWQDYSRVIDAQRWNKNTRQWVPAGIKQFEYTGKLKPGGVAKDSKYWKEHEFGLHEEKYEWCDVCQAETRHYYSPRYRSLICSKCRSI